MTKHLALAALPLMMLAACSSSNDDTASRPIPTSSTTSATSASSPSSTGTSNASSSATSTSSRIASRTTSPTSPAVDTTTASRTTAIAPAAPHRRTFTPSTSPRPRRAAPTAAKTADCTDLGTGKHYACTQAEYDAINEGDEPSYLRPTKTQCHNKDEPASLEVCKELGYPYGMTAAEMRQHDKTATCATGTMLYWGEHDCRIVRQTPTTLTYNDGSVMTL